jgi:glucose-1-phosphate thymidylyltransferase
MKGIVLAGGTGSRLWPITLGTNKHLLPVYDKPMIHYPIATIMAAGIREILIISNPADLDSYKKLLGDGSEIGVQFHFAIQENPRGIAESFIIAEEFLKDSPVCLILGDNIFHGSGLGRQLMENTKIDGAQIFAYGVSNPSDYGVIEFSKEGVPISIEEKPLEPKSNFAIPGLYFFDNSVIDIAKNVKPSPRGELEITDVIRNYMAKSKLHVSILPRGTAWLDTGSIQNLHDASSYIKVIEERQGSKVGCIEEVSWRLGWIEDSKLESIADRYVNSPYGHYLRNLPHSREFGSDLT